MTRVGKVWILAAIMLAVAGLWGCAAQGALAASVEKAEMLNQHGLTREAKAELVDVIFNKHDADKAQAYYLLGGIAFDENRIAVALDSWRELVEKYPTSPQAEAVKDRINEIAEVVGEAEKESIDNAIALSYLRHGDFWSRGKHDRFTIDSSWIQNVEAAVKWYDKVISEFPKSTASRIAYQDKLRTLLGWEEPGRFGSKYGVESSLQRYMPRVLATFASFERDHPTASTLQGFRYQIAQAYWENKDWAKTREWLNLIIEHSGEGDSFYKDLAERRLNKVEY
jgi:tetratricopeptide (TPR) repeat protein